MNFEPYCTHVIFLPGLRLMQAEQTYSRVSTHKHISHCKNTSISAFSDEQRKKCARRIKTMEARGCRASEMGFYEEMSSFCHMGIRLGEHKEFTQRARCMTEGVLPSRYRHKKSFHFFHQLKILYCPWDLQSSGLQKVCLSV